MRKTGGGGLSANFANFREFVGRGILTGDDADFRRWDKRRKDRIITRQDRAEIPFNRHVSLISANGEAARTSHEKKPKTAKKHCAALPPHISSQPASDLDHCRIDKAAAHGARTPLSDTFVREYDNRHKELADKAVRAPCQFENPSQAGHLNRIASRNGFSFCPSALSSPGDAASQ